MELNIKNPLLCLRPGEVVTLDDAIGTRISAQSGLVWVTEEGDGVDHIVSAGEARVVGHDGRTVVQALQPAWVALQ